MFDPAESDFAASKKVQNSTRGSHDHLGSPTQLQQLL